MLKLACNADTSWFDHNVVSLIQMLEKYVYNLKYFDIYICKVKMKSVAIKKNSEPVYGDRNHLCFVSDERVQKHILIYSL